jgi:sulfofructose kinase
MSPKRDIDVLCVGTAAYDLIFNVDQHPGADEKSIASGFASSGGGPAANAAVAICRLGCSAAFVGYLGDDIYGDLNLRELQDEGVNTSYVVRGTAATPLSVVLVKPDGRRALVNYNEHDKNIRADVETLLCLRPGVVLFDGHEPALSVQLAARIRAASADIQTVLDAGSVHRGTTELVSLVDYIVASEKFALDYTGESRAERALAQLGRFNVPVVVTMGPRGCIWQNGSETGETAAYVVDAVDSNGAGDAFHGAFAAGLLAGMAWPALLRFCSAVAALCCTRTGARLSMPEKQEVEFFMNRKGREK